MYLPKLNVFDVKAKLPEILYAGLGGTWIEITLEFLRGQ
jgi:hypothetical protein